MMRINLPFIGMSQFRSDVGTNSCVLHNNGFTNWTDEWVLAAVVCDCLSSYFLKPGKCNPPSEKWQMLHIPYV